MKDIVNVDGEFMSVTLLKLKISITINCMYLNSIKTAIPKQWMSKISPVSIDKFQDFDSLNINMEIPTRVLAVLNANISVEK